MSKLTSVPNVAGLTDDDAGSVSSDGGSNLGEALSKFDFSHLSDSGAQTELGSHGLDHSDLHAALASMSTADALDYAISHLGALDHLDPVHADAGHGDAGHFDMPPDTSHDA
jgi:hypothetical protein